MCKIITIAGQRGGIGKSAICTNLAASLALLEKKTLIVDCDPKGCATAFAGLENFDFSHDLGSVFSGKAEPADVVLNTKLGFLNIIPAGFNLFYSASRLSQNLGNEKILRIFLNDIKDNYDYIIIDPPSSFSFLAATAMAASDWLVVPFSCSLKSIVAFKSLLKMINYIKKNLNVHLKIAGFVFNRCSRSEVDSFLSRQESDGIKDIVYATYIPDDDLISHSADIGKPVALCDIESPGSKAYLNFAYEIDSFF